MKFLSVYPLQRLARSGSFLYNSWFICDSPVTIQKNSGRWHKRSNRRAASLLRKHNMIIYHWGVGDGHNRRGGGWFRVWHQFLMTVKQYWKLGASQTSAVGGRGGGGGFNAIYTGLLPLFSHPTPNILCILDTLYIVRDVEEAEGILSLEGHYGPQKSVGDLGIPSPPSPCLLPLLSFPQMSCDAICYPPIASSSHAFII